MFFISQEIGNGQGIQAPQRVRTKDKEQPASVNVLPLLNDKENCQGEKKWTLKDFDIGKPLGKGEGELFHTGSASIYV